MDPLTMLSLGGMATGFLGKLFGSNPEEEYQKRKVAAADALRAAKTKALSRITKIITGQTSSNIAQATQGGTERAVSMGRPDAANAMIQPLVSKVATAGSESLQRGVGQINSDYDQQMANLELSGLDRPVQPNAGDYVAELGKGVSNFAGQQAYLDAVAPKKPTTKVLGYTDMGQPVEQVSEERSAVPAPESLVPPFEEQQQFTGMRRPMIRRRTPYGNPPDFTTAGMR